jgi:hypothetical protein
MGKRYRSIDQRLTQRPYNFGKRQRRTLNVQRPTSNIGYGRGAGVGRARGVGVGLAVGAGVGVGVGVGLDWAQYLPPLLKLVESLVPPQTIISLPLQVAV